MPRFRTRTRRSRSRPTPAQKRCNALLEDRATPCTKQISAEAIRCRKHQREYTRILAEYKRCAHFVDYYWADAMRPIFRGQTVEETHMQMKSVSVVIRFLEGEIYGRVYHGDRFFKDCEWFIALLETTQFIIVP